MTTVILTRKQLAEQLSLHPRTLARWEKEGMPVMIINSKVKRYDLAAVTAWMTEKATI